MTKILDSQRITKEIALNKLLLNLSQNEIDEYLDILIAINNGQSVFNIKTNKGEYLFFIEDDAIKSAKKKL